MAEGRRNRYRQAGTEVEGGCHGAQGTPLLWKLVMSANVHRCPAASEGETPVDWCDALGVWQIMVFADNLLILTYCPRKLQKRCAQVESGQGAGYPPPLPPPLRSLLPGWALGDTRSNACVLHAVPRQTEPSLVGAHASVGARTAQARAAVVVRRGATQVGNWSETTHRARIGLRLRLAPGLSSQHRV